MSNSIPYSPLLEDSSARLKMYKRLQFESKLTISHGPSEDVICLSYAETHSVCMRKFFE